mmetsp:Transcript_914/g.917  ORF Transcript_914/g.917 Transcript_914/m.917 type:complete len:80 (-) Transcript_914:349-588(-)
MTPITMKSGYLKTCCLIWLKEKFSLTSWYTRSRVNKESLIPVKRDTIKESNATQCNKSGKGFFSLEEKKVLGENETTPN